MTDEKKNKSQNKDLHFEHLVGREEIHWADLVGITFAEEKFLLSFAQFNPNKKTYYYVSEIALTPKIAESLSKILADSIVNYKKSFQAKTK
jgi:hypothetical protein